GIQNLLIATDFSQCSRPALDFGLQVAKTYRAAAHIVFVIPSDEFLLAGPSAYVAAKDAAARDLQELKSELGRKRALVEGRDYRLYLLEGQASQAILDFACRRQIDLIVLGTHGRGGLGKALIGSVAERVFRQSPVPVLTLGPHLRRAVLDDVARNILVAVDFTPASTRAVQFAVGLARTNNAKLTLLHIVDPKQLEHIPDRAAVRHGIETQLTGLLGHAREDVNCSVRVETGQVVPAVLHVLKEMGADLLVMGVRPPSGVLDRLMFPRAYELVRESSCPVLTFREKRANSASPNEK
ncbi:MAG TPA: universal stress protein, partial [Terriglobales bacterium]|nr:universal stress protein [Terriglobales bacterium]